MMCFQFKHTVTCLAIKAGEMPLALAQALVHVKHAAARAVFSANQRDVNFVRQATAAAFEAVKASALAVEAHPLPGAVGQKAVDCVRGGATVGPR